jgi:Polyphosphate kinase N-terminal domain
MSGGGWAGDDEAMFISRPVAVTPVSPGALVNRELSWLSFARRVLALAEDPRGDTSHG